MRLQSLLLMASALTMFFSGCVYVHTVEPLTVNMDHTPIAKTEKEGTIKTIGLPLIYSGVQLVAWGNAAIGEVAKKQEMKEVYYADLEIFRILWIWNEYTVHVYGK